MKASADQQTLSEFLKDIFKTPIDVFNEIKDCPIRQTQLGKLFLAKDATFNPHSKWLSLHISVTHKDSIHNRLISFDPLEIQAFFSLHIPVLQVRGLSDNEFLMETSTPLFAHILKLAFDGIQLSSLDIKFDIESAQEFREHYFQDFHEKSESVMSQTNQTGRSNPFDKQTESSPEKKMKVKNKLKFKSNFPENFTFKSEQTNKKGGFRENEVSATQHVFLPPQNSAVFQQQPNFKVCKTSNFLDAKKLKVPHKDSFGSIAFELEQANEFLPKNTQFLKTLTSDQAFCQIFPSLVSEEAPEFSKTEKVNMQIRKFSLVHYAHNSLNDEPLPAFDKTASDCFKQKLKFHAWPEEVKKISLKHPENPQIEIPQFDSDFFSSVPDGPPPSGIRIVNQLNNCSSAPMFPPNLNNKYTCRYDIAIEHSPQFPIAKKVIGSNGCNMKEIIEKSKIKGIPCDDSTDSVKLRLRGKGSGFKEGHDKKESSETLHLCVSAKNQKMFNLACSHVEKLLQKIYEDFLVHLKKNGDVRVLAEEKEFLENLKFRKHLPNH